MNKFILFTVGLFALTACSDNNEPANEEKTEPIETATAYNEQLANELGADSYGMKKYVMAFLKSGPNRDQDSAEVIRLQRAHMDNIKRLAEERKLVVAGPFLDDTEVRGIYIFDVGSIEEAEALTQSDPAIQAGRLVMELHPWYGSAALIQTADIHRTLSKKEI